MMDTRGAVFGIRKNYRFTGSLGEGGSICGSTGRVVVMCFLHTHSSLSVFSSLNKECRRVLRATAHRSTSEVRAPVPRYVNAGAKAWHAARHALVEKTRGVGQRARCQRVESRDLRPSNSAGTNTCSMLPARSKFEPTANRSAQRSERSTFNPSYLSDLKFNPRIRRLFSVHAFPTTRPSSLRRTSMARLHASVSSLSRMSVL